MSKKLSDLEIDHHYAPGYTPPPDPEPTFTEVFFAWVEKQSPYELSDAIVLTGLLIIFYLFFRAIRSVFRAFKDRETRESFERSMDARHRHQEAMAAMRAKLAQGQST